MQLLKEIRYMKNFEKVYGEIINLMKYLLKNAGLVQENKKNLGGEKENFLFERTVYSDESLLF